jgi:phage gp36-like protein
MSYATQTDLALRITEAELIRLTDEDDQGEVNADTIEAALDAATIEIDSYLAVRYPLPLADEQPLLVGLCCDLAIWNLYAGVEQAGVPEVRRIRHEQAIATLKRLAAGAQTLGAPPSSQGSEAAAWTGEAKVFTRSKMQGL